MGEYLERERRAYAALQQAIDSNDHKSIDRLSREWVYWRSMRHRLTDPNRTNRM